MPSLVDYTLLQPHTVNLYDLKNQTGVVENISSRKLLTSERFDLFAKLFYIRNRDNNHELANQVYLEHIRIFNPDGKEPGREDKKSFVDFVKTFDRLIDFFRNNDFNEGISIVPIGKNHVILDGSHRVAALAYFNKQVTVARFEEVVSNGPFNYRYFITRGLPVKIADIIAFEAINWLPDIRVACLWPRMGSSQNKDKAEKKISEQFDILYSREIKVSLNALKAMIVRIYQSQNWVGSKENGYVGAKAKAYECFSHNRKVRFVFFIGRDQEVVSAVKESIREVFHDGKHSIHITDNETESISLAKSVLTEKGRSAFFLRRSESIWSKTCELFSESVAYFHNVIWLEIKVGIVKLLRIR